jgi:AcrR family transcriptional regulator
MANSKLTRELIAAAAVEMLEDGEGLASLSMRKLGSRLGVEAMSLYHYVDNKDDLLDAMLANVYGRVILPSPGHWETQLRQAVGSFYEVLTSSRAVFELITRRPALGAESLAVIFFGTKRFEEAGLAITDAVAALHVSFGFVIGHVVVSQGATATPTGSGNMDRTQHSSQEMQQFVGDITSITHQQQFQTGLEVVIAGLKARYPSLS